MRRPDCVAADAGAALGALVRPGMTIALGDGVGQIGRLNDGITLGARLSAIAKEKNGIRLVLGWMPAAPDGLDPDAFDEVVALMPGWGVRSIAGSARARFVPTSLAAAPSLLRNNLRPDLLITRLAQRRCELHFSTEVSWQRDLIAAGVPVAAVLDPAAPVASAAGPVDGGSVTIIGTAGDGPVLLAQRPTEGVHDALADRVLELVPAGARLQYGPGQLGTALLRRASVPLQIDTGLLTDAVVELDQRGLLIGQPSATYLVGSDVLYNWADGRPILRGIEYTHCLSRLIQGEPFIAVNTAIEIDPVGQINVEGVGDKVVGGIGGHPDFCTAARQNREGLSIIAVPSRFAQRSPLVERLSRPVSTPAHDVDVIVTESAAIDLRGADWSKRRRMISELFC